MCLDLLPGRFAGSKRGCDGHGIKRIKVIDQGENKLDQNLTGSQVISQVIEQALLLD